jgi:hypothetical protein
MFDTPEMWICLIGWFGIDILGQLKIAIIPYISNNPIDKRHYEPLIIFPRKLYKLYVF